jgi:YfiH family protein
VSGTDVDTGRYRLEGMGAARRLALPRLDGIPGLVHAFTVVGSETSAVVEALAGRAMPIRALHQVHGAGVVVVTDAAPRPGPHVPPGDALVTSRRGVVLGVRVADCVPILAVAPASGLIAAVHAGWRGTVAGVLPAALRTMGDLGAASGDVRLAMGPSIGACCFEVGPEVVEALAGAVPGIATCVVPGPRPRVDLIEANRRQAIACGVARRHIAAAGLCTACRPDLLESYRRSRGAPGRMTAVIAWRD